MPHAKKIPATKAVVDKEWQKLEKIPAWDITRSQKQIRGDPMKQGRRAQKFILHHWWTYVI